MYHPLHHSIDSTTVDDRARIRDAALKRDRVTVFRSAPPRRLIAKIA